MRDDPIAVAGAERARRRGTSSSVDAHRSAAPRSSPRVEQRRRRGGVPQHGERVDVGRVDGEHVAAVAADDHRRIAERPAQLGDLRLQRVAARVDGIVRPTGRRRAGRCARARRRRARGAPTAPTSCRAGTDTGSPSRRTSTGPSTEIESTVRVYEAGQSRPSRRATGRRRRTRSRRRSGCPDSRRDGRGPRRRRARCSRPGGRGRSATTCRSRLVAATARARSSRLGCRSSSAAMTISDGVVGRVGVGGDPGDRVRRRHRSPVGSRCRRRRRSWSAACTAPLTLR